MARYVFKLPDVGEGTAEAEIVAWHVSVGQTIAEDDPLIDVMTDKATVEMTSPVSGVVLELNGVPGDLAPVGSGIVVIDTAEDGAQPATSEPATSEPATSEPATSEPVASEPVASGPAIASSPRSGPHEPDLDQGAPVALLQPTAGVGADLGGPCGPPTG